MLPSPLSWNLKEHLNLRISNISSSSTFNSAARWFLWNANQIISHTCSKFSQDSPPHWRRTKLLSTDSQTWHGWFPLLLLPPLCHVPCCVLVSFFFLQCIKHIPTSGPLHLRAICLNPVTLDSSFPHLIPLNFLKSLPWPPFQKSSPVTCPSLDCTCH